MHTQTTRTGPTRVGGHAAGLALALLAQPLLAQQIAQADSARPEVSVAQAPALDPVEVRGRRQDDKKALSNAAEALPTPTYILDKEKLEALPFSDATDLLRSTPGITFGSSSAGGDIGDDISIRGFNGFHGATVAILIDGVPVNWAHANFGAHGSTDLNWLFPEIVERVEIIKGPFSALYGNFNLSGAINIITKTSDVSSVAAEAGAFANYRGIGIYSRPLGMVTPFIALEALDRKGYRAQSDYRRYNIFNKFSVPLGDGRLAFRFNVSQRDSRNAGFLLAGDVRSGAVSRRSAAPGTETDNGRIEYLSFVVNYLPKDERGFSGTVYAGHDRYFLADTSFGAPQFANSNNRTHGGWRFLKSWSWERALLTAGTDGQGSAQTYRNSDVDAGVATLSNSRDTDDLTAGLFVQGQLRPIDPLKLIGGLRYDHFKTRVENFLFANSGTASSDVWSPKLGVVYTPIPWLDVFANTGRGFRSPAGSEISPNRAAPFNGSLEVARLRSSDLGITLRAGAGVNLTVAAFETKTERELRRDPANPVNVINIGGTTRDGYEVVAEWFATDTLSVSASHTKVDTRIDSPATPGADLVITVPDTTQTAAVSWRTALAPALRLHADFYAQRIGRRPLAADGSLYAEPQTVYGAKARLTRGRVSGFVQLDYSPDKFSSDFVFNIGGIAYDPRPELSMLVGVKYAFD